MIKLITPPGMLLTVALLVIYSAYAFLIGSIEDSWPLLIGGVVAVIAGYGTAMLMPWSRYLVYALAIGFIGKLGLSISGRFAPVTSVFSSERHGRAAVVDTGPADDSALLRLLCARIQALPRATVSR